jgi:hypothetical protein
MTEPTLLKRHDGNDPPGMLANPPFGDGLHVLQAEEPPGVPTIEASRIVRAEKPAARGVPDNAP